MLVSLPQERSTAEQVYAWIARSRSGSSSFTASALINLPNPLPPPGSHLLRRHARPEISQRVTQTRCTAWGSPGDIIVR